MTNGIPSPPRYDGAAVAVTGATGYVGRAVVNALAGQGVNVIALTRRPPAQRVEWRTYDLREAVAPGLLDGVTAVIHLAAETGRSAAVDVEGEVAALEKLAEACRRQGARLVFVSSQTAHPNAPTGYGRAKWLCEQVAHRANGVVVRPGQVYGGAEAGLFGLLCRLVQLSPIVPAFTPQPNVQPVHVDDLASGLITCALEPGLDGGMLEIAASAPVGFTTFLRLIAEIRLRRMVIGVPIPVALIVALGRLPLLPSTIRDAAHRIESLVRLPPMATEASLARLRLNLRPLRDGLSRSGRARRRLLIEASTLIGYLARGPAPCGSVKRYARAVEALYQGAPLAIASTFRRWPRLLALVDQPLLRRRDPAAAFWTRIDLATVCVETSVESAERFLVSAASNRMLEAARLGWQLGLQAICMALAVPFGEALIRRLPRLPSGEPGA